MNIPTYCTNCETSEGVRLQCKGCNFARFCSRDCQKKCWKKHKRYCMPLNDAVNESIEKLRPFLRDNYRIDNHENLHCMLCLEGGTSEDPLFHSGCGCRPDSGMSIGHIKCFQEFARASFADEKKREDSADCCADQCSNCSQERNGIIAFEMNLILWKLYDSDGLTRKNVQGIDNKRAFFMRRSLVCLEFALRELVFNSAHYDLITCCRLRILYLIKNVRKQIELNEYTRIQQEIMEDLEIGNILIGIKKYHVAIDFNRRNYEKYLLDISEYPVLKCYSHGVLFNYAVSLFEVFKFEVFKASLQKSDAGNNPPYHYLEEAERLMREDAREGNLENIIIYVNNTILLCNILMCQRKFAEANQILTPCLQKAQRVYGPSHEMTKRLLDLDEKIRPYT